MNEKEKNTVSLMIRIYCRSKHKQKNGLCPECKQVEDYAHLRLEKCPFKEEKPFCNKCTVHCYKKEYREKVKEIMRFSGPRMIFYSPVKAIKHLLSNLS